MRSKGGTSQLTTKQELILNLGDSVLHEGLCGKSSYQSRISY